MLNTYKEMFLLFVLLTTGKQVVLFSQMLQLSLIFVWHSLKLLSAIFFLTIKNVLFHLKSYFRSEDIQIFVFSAFPLFFPVSHFFRG